MEKSGFYKNVYKQKHHFINKEKKADTKILVKITVNIRVKMVYYSQKKTQLSTKMKLKTNEVLRTQVSAVLRSA